MLDVKPFLEIATESGPQPASKLTREKTYHIHHNLANDNHMYFLVDGKSAKLHQCIPM